MFKGIGDLASAMKAAQQMGGKMKELKEQLATARAVGSAGGGLVEAEVNGMGDVLRVTIDPTLIQEGDRELIEDLIPAAVNQAQIKAKQLHQEAIQSIAGGLNLPGLNDALAQLTGDK
jgi:nucleoid-associated protein EbfC